MLQSEKLGLLIYALRAKRHRCPSEMPDTKYLTLGDRGVKGADVKETDVAGVVLRESDRIKRR